jgi:ABC-type multidrug transport system fused ATPase/permease subunit
VAFAYQGRTDVLVLNNINLRAKKGEQIALVGPSGAGKSTIASLLLQFYKPTKGHILFDGKEANDFPLSQLRMQLAYVPQDVMLFGGTIKENIAYGKPSATDEEIMDAAKKANAHEFIDKFPEQYETIVGERGIKLSGGQRQRIAIARAILKDPAILILDEATSALDNQTEKAVMNAVYNLSKDITIIIIAHRLTTVKNCDMIFLLENGELKSYGTFEKLFNSKSFYKNFK